MLLPAQSATVQNADRVVVDTGAREGLGRVYALLFGR